MSSFFKYKDIHKYMWCTQGTKSIIDYAIANEKTAKLVKDTRVYRGAELNTDFLLCTKLQFLPGWKNSKNCNKFNRRNDHPPQTKYKTRLLNDDGIKWLYRRRIEDHLKNTTEDTGMETEWSNIQNIINKAACESLGKIKIQCRRKY
jgi:hypothetical protein